MEKKVSIITPCYNGARFIHRLFDSILAQGYSNIELIFVNDGSTDNTEEIALSYQEAFANKGCTFIYIYQGNSGQAAALNKGLRIFNGDYLIWPDSDDFLSSDSIKVKVDFLEKHPDYGMVRSDAFVVHESDISQVLRRVATNNPSKYKEELFDDYLMEINAWFPPGVFMVKTPAFLSTIPSRQIYESRGGQNWQMLLPIMSKYKCGYIDEPLYTIVTRNDSHSRNIKSYKDKVNRANCHQDLLQHVIMELDIPTDYYISLIDQKYARRRFELAYTHMKADDCVREYNTLQQLGILTRSDNMKLFLVQHPALYYISKYTREIKRKIIH